MSIGRRLRELEQCASSAVAPAETEKGHERIREQAEHSNNCRENKGEPPNFEIDEYGDVFCTHDGRPVTNPRQILAEDFYWMETGWGCPSPGLVHDEEAQAFYTQSGELALSRDFVDLRKLMGKERREA